MVTPGYLFGRRLTRMQDVGLHKLKARVKLSVYSKIGKAPHIYLTSFGSACQCGTVGRWAGGAVVVAGGGGPPWPGGARLRRAL